GDTLYMHQQKVIELGLENRVHFLGLRQDVPTLVKTSDILVLSTNFEGFGLVAVEGMAAGKPVIASNVPGLKEVVNGAGILFPAKDDDCLAREIEHLFKDEDYRNIIAKRCLQRAMKYDVKFMIEKYLLIYNECLNS
ncbi:glycosyltransferase, partial [uncultured Bacteroides sp.]